MSRNAVSRLLIYTNQHHCHYRSIYIDSSSCIVKGVKITKIILQCNVFCNFAFNNLICSKSFFFLLIKINLHYFTGIYIVDLIMKKLEFLSLITYLLYLVDVLSNRQSAILWVPTVHLFASIYSFIHMTQTSYRCF